MKIMKFCDSYTLQAKVNNVNYLFYVEECSTVIYFSVRKVGFEMPCLMDKVSKKVLKKQPILNYIKSLIG